jgi:hypothetical protein
VEEDKPWSKPMRQTSPASGGAGTASGARKIIRIRMIPWVRSVMGVSSRMYGSIARGERWGRVYRGLERLSRLQDHRLTKKDNELGCVGEDAKSHL